MVTNERAIEILNDLIKINNDRTEGYEKAINKLGDVDADLRTIFQTFATNSSRHTMELTDQVVQLGGHPSDNSTAPGKIYRAWMDVKNAFTGGDRLSVLNDCEFGEDAAQKAYRLALEEQEVLPESARLLVIEQQASLQKAHDLIKETRDIEKVL